MIQAHKIVEKANRAYLTVSQIPSPPWEKEEKQPTELRNKIGQYDLDKNPIIGRKPHHIQKSLFAKTTAQTAMTKTDKRPVVAT